MLVEQAIFTSTQTDRAEGYQLAAASSGLTSEDRQELSVWGPSHDSLAASDPQASSINFFALASGKICVSRSVAASGEYSGRTGPRIDTHCLVASPDVWLRFANNPFALLRAAIAQGTVRVQEALPAQLDAFRLVGRCTPVDYGLLTDLAHDPGVDWLAGALAMLVAEPRCGLAAPPASAARVVAGLLNCLPVECRSEISFTTGLRWSARRPFRLLCVSPDVAEIRRAERQQGPIFSVAGQALNADSLRHGWGAYVAEILRSGRASHLGNVLASAPAGLRLADLNAWADHLRSENWIKLEDPTAPPRAPADSPTTAAGPLRIADVSRCDAAATQPLRRPAGLTDEPARRAGAADPQMFEILDLLDDAVFDALDGRDGALEQLRKVWPQAVRHVGAEILGESKEEYVKRALAHWHQEQAQHPGRDAAAANLLEVLCVVFGA